MESARYQIHVASFLNEKKCKMITRDFTEVITFLNDTLCGNLDKYLMVAKQGLGAMM